ncbi:uncharacterized protein LOC111709292 [Eurytemora carolleeae]|uniref:uncharacterized protein LOC111709292 n=1 Tax=Eurytemora carolleeae TaxID=1294199 RepID=UPI000C77F5E4|nr:uncharacterized protein LOC111709292 [Eurytemora carolleeae]|eukprot:XP_023338688.1 uncharacterized protein LOC111709292 [Eurytemora affinis]
MDLEDSSLSFQSSLSVQEGRLNMCQSSPSVQGGRLNMRQSSPSVQGGRLNKCQSSPSVQGGRLNMCQSSPSIQEGRLNMRQSSPSVQGGVLNMRQSSPCVQGGGINMRQSSPSVQSGGLNMRQSSPSVQSGGLNMRQSSPIVQGGGLNMRQSSPSVQGGELNMCQSSPSVQGGGLNMRQSSPSVQGGGLNMRNTGFLEHQIVGTVVRDGTEYTDINSSGRDCRLKSHLRASNKEKRLRSVSESGRSPGSTGSPGSSGSSGDWSTLEARNFSRTSSGIFCRICHDADGAEALISPCQCSGSVALVHRTCIEKWLSTVNNDTCELCHHKYMISRHPRPFVTWLCAPSVEDDQRNLVGDIICFILLTPLAGISTYLCASGASFYLKAKLFSLIYKLAYRNSL